VLTLDLHAGQIQGFFDIPTDNLFAAPVMVRDIKERFGSTTTCRGLARRRRRGARPRLAKRIDAPLAIIDKRRERPANPK
jgi:ribose-phosphate pyrophosphokinase